MVVDGTSVEFTVKELLGDINAKLVGISDKLDTKAGALDLLNLAGRVTDLEKGALTQGAIKSNATQARNARLAAYAALITTLGVVVTFLAIIVQ